MFSGIRLFPKPKVRMSHKLACCFQRASFPFVSTGHCIMQNAVGTVFKNDTVCGPLVLGMFLPKLESHCLPQRETAEGLFAAGPANLWSHRTLVSLMSGALWWIPSLCVSREGGLST